MLYLGYNTVYENINGTPKMRKYDHLSNIAISILNFTFAPHLVIALPTSQ